MPTSESVIAETPTAGNAVAWSSALSSANTAAPVSPFVIPADQVYFWTRAWQAGEAESQADLAAGETEVFADARSAIRWLFSSEE